MLNLLTFRIVACIIMLTYASYMDLKTREITDKLWFISSAIGIATLLYEYLFEGIPLYRGFLMILSIGITSAVSILLYYAGFYGGADAKALISLSLLLPLYQPLYSLYPFAPLITFNNSIFTTLILPIYFLIKNLIRMVRGEKIFQGFESEPVWKKFLVCLLGYRLDIDERKKFYFALEESVNGKRRFKISLLRADEDYLQGGGVWATPGVPFILYITVGFVIMILVGDLLAILIRGIFNFFR
ncbi:MAG: prepilin peptidase [Nitrososphaerota archaeon]|nr:prepilin peptidase [Nitrososphaerales archaeon]MDW8045268.1 prepilin peptidase [Nitrososphaerota archaeon]